MRYPNQLAVMTLSLFAFNSFAKAPVYTGYFSDKAVSGYDTVAYFTQNQAVKGNSNFKYSYKEATWYFNSEAHLTLFKSEPEKYAPQYGGYCAYALALNDTVSADPKQWSIEDGKLYLNYNAEIKQKWLKNKEDYIILADDNWPLVLK